jgi:hypothetical protein
MRVRRGEHFHLHRRTHRRCTARCEYSQGLGAKIGIKKDSVQSLHFQSAALSFNNVPTRTVLNFPHRWHFALPISVTFILYASSKH